jgi:hypothetical protein
VLETCLTLVDGGLGEGGLARCMLRAPSGARFLSDAAESVVSEKANKMAALLVGATRLAVPFKEKQTCKKLGGRWNPLGKFWYVPKGIDPEAFAQWYPKQPAEPVVVPPGTCAVYFNGSNISPPSGASAVGAVLKKCCPTTLFSLARCFLCCVGFPREDLRDSLDRDGKVLWSGAKFLGDSFTNNEAKWEAVLFGIEKAKSLGNFLILPGLVPGSTLSPSPAGRRL